MADVFISYAHIDNEPFGTHQSRWVTGFTEHLRARLGQVTGRPVEVWRDPSLGGSAIISREIREQIEAASVMVSVLSPRYMASASCRDEIRLFEETGAPCVGSRRRIMKVVKTPLPLAGQPEIFRDTKGFEFFRVHPETGRPLEYESDSIEYWQILNDLAYEIRDLIGAEETVISPRASVYLAETTSDVAGERLQIFRDLKDRGYRLLPEAPLPLESERFRAAVEAALSGVKLSIHLVGARYSATFEAETSSVVELQCEIAASRRIPVIIWIPPGLPVSDTRQSDFIKRIDEGKVVRNGCEILKTRMEELKTFLQERLETAPKPAGPTPPRGAPPHLYLVCDSQDRPAVKPICDFAFDSGFELTLPLESGSPTEIREDHEENLRLCDGVLVYWGDAAAAWTRKQLRDVLKAPGQGRVKPALHAGFYLAAPETTEKNEFRSHYFNSRNYGPFNSSFLAPFFHRIAHAAGGIG